MTYKTLAEIESLVRAFENCTLPRSCWTHQAHLTVALWYLTHFSAVEAIGLICDRIRKYNTAIGIENTNNSGYHQTITLFWVRLILSYLIREIEVYSFVDLANNLINTYNNPELIFECYSHNLLLSCEARTSWVEPDIKQLIHLFDS